MSRIAIYPYKFVSASAIALGNSLREKGYHCIRVRPDGKYVRRPDDLVINWGSHTVPNWTCGGILNEISDVVTAGNKLEAFNKLSRIVPVPEYTTDQELAQAWLAHDGLVVERELLNASGGRGIILHKDPKKSVGKSPLYTRYFKKMREYRVHVASGDVIDWQQKMLKADSNKDEIDFQIRNHDNGWIFARDSAKPIPKHILDISVQAVVGLGLTFGAVDIGYNERRDLGVVFEVNTAPGLTGETTINSYTNFVIDHYEDRH